LEDAAAVVGKRATPFGDEAEGGIMNRREFKE